MRSKKILSLICSAVLAFGAAAVPVLDSGVISTMNVSANSEGYYFPSEEFTEGDWRCYFAKEDGKTRVWIAAYYNQKEKNVVVPPTIRGYKVTRICANAFYLYNGYAMTDLTIPSSLNCIEGLAFQDTCPDLKNIHINNNPNFEFKNGILYGRNVTKNTGIQCCLGTDKDGHIKNVDIKKSVIKCVNQNAQVEIEEGVDVIEDWAFIGLSNLKHVVIPTGVKSIQLYAFAHTGLEEVDIPYGCEYIEQGAFCRAENLKRVSFPSTLTQIRTSVFEGTALKSVYIPDSVYYIESGAFDEIKIYGNYKEPDEDGNVDNPPQNYCDHDENAEYADAPDKDGNYPDVTHDPDDPYDHFYIYAVNIKPTCTTPGALAGICFCGHTYYQPLPATGHAFALQGVDADGTAHYKCAVCGEEKIVKTGIVMNVLDKITSKETHDYSALEITVFDKDGAIAKDADVNGTSKAAVDSLEDGKYSALVSMAGFVPRTVEFSVTDGQAEEVDAELHRTGDITGDGNLNAADLLRAKSHINGINSLEDYDYDCANVDENDKLNAADLLQMKAHVKGVNKLW